MTQLTTVQAQRVVDCYLAALRDQDLIAIMALFADDATVEDPVGSERICGRAAIEAFYRVATARPIHAELTGPLRVAGNAVAFPFRATASRPEGEFETEIIDVFYIDEQGLITTMQAYWGPANSRRR